MTVPKTRLQNKKARQLGLEQDWSGSEAAETVEQQASSSAGFDEVSYTAQELDMTVPEIEAAMGSAEDTLSPGALKRLAEEEFHRRQTVSSWCHDSI